MEYKNAALELKEHPSETGSFEGYASVFNVVDNGLDKVSPGAFRKSLGERKPKLLWQHDMGSPIGVWDEVKEDEHGLYVRGRLSMDVAKGREARSLMQMGAIDSLSIGYRTKRAESEGGGVRNLMELELWEISVVTMPMLRDATVSGIKSASDINNIKDFNEFLRNAGFSKKAANAIAMHGWNAKDNRRNADEVEAEQAAYRAVMDQIRQLKENANV